MARVVKKVNKTKFKPGKKFYIILSSILFVLIGTGVGLGIYFYYENNTEEDTIDFVEYSEYKMNYSDIDDVINGEKQHIFIFVYDGSLFDIEENPKTDKLTYNRVVSLIKAINEKNAEIHAIDVNNEGIITFRLIDVSLTGNAGILTDSKLGSLGSSPALIYIYGETYSSVTKNTDEDKTEVISGSGNKINTYIADAIEYIKNLKE